MPVRPEELLGQALDGDESAFVALLDLLEQPVYAYFRRRRVSPEDAEDLTQQVFLALLDPGARFDERRGVLRGFVFGIARRVWLKHMTSTGRTPSSLPTDVLDASLETPDSAADRAEQCALVVAAIDGLPERARDVLTLRFHQGLSIAEIADAMSLPENTVKSHLFRARTQLRESIGSKLDMKEGH